MSPFYLTRDKAGELWLFESMPKRKDSIYVCNDIQDSCMPINDCDLFPEVKWENPGPTEVEINIKNNNI